MCDCLTGRLGHATLSMDANGGSGDGCEGGWTVGGHAASVRGRNRQSDLSRRCRLAPSLPSSPHARGSSAQPAYRGSPTVLPRESLGVTGPTQPPFYLPSRTRARPGQLPAGSSPVWERIAFVTLTVPVSPLRFLNSFPYSRILRVAKNTNT